MNTDRAAGPLRIWGWPPTSARSGSALDHQPKGVPLPRTMTFVTSLSDSYGLYSAYTEVPVATEEELLEFANKVRKAGGANVIEALLPSVPGNAFYCLIANALNFSCQVRPATRRFKSGARMWRMHFPCNMAEERIRKIADAAGCDTELVHKRVVMVLPEHIGNAAAAFDGGVAFKEFDKSPDD